MRISDWSSDVCSSDLDTCDEERLLGVSLTGVCDNLNLLGEADVLATLRETVVETNKEWADRLGIAPSVATTCVKPSGTVSQLVNSSSGLHTRHSPYYLRTVRADNKDPLTQFLKASGIRSEEHTSELQSLMRISYAVFCLKKKTTTSK